MLSAILLATALSVDVASCESLQSLSLPDTTILSAAVVPAGPFTPAQTPAMQKPQTLQVPVAACRVAGVEGFVAVVYTDESADRTLPGADLIGALRRTARACGIDVVDALTVAADGWGSHLEPTLPRGGHPLALIEHRAPASDQSSGADLPLVDASEVAGTAAALASLESALTVLCGIPSTLGAETRVTGVTVRWADGVEEAFGNYDAGRTVVLRRGAPR